MEPVVQGREILANVLEAMKKDTRQFARRQRTWGLFEEYSAFQAAPDFLAMPELSFAAVPWKCCRR